MKKLLIFLITAIIAFSLFGCSANSTGDIEVTHKNEGTEETLQEDMISATHNSEDAEEKAQEDVPEGHKKALDCALSYLKYTPYSYIELIDQIEFEGFTTEEAIYAADNCGANWREQAVRAVAEYLEYGSPSYALLKEALEKADKFSAEDVAYAVDNCGGDWFREAAESANYHLQQKSLTKDELIAILERELFTHEQAVYGAEQNGL